MSKHTPEPWEVSTKADGNWWHIGSGNQAIAAVHAASKKRNEPYASMFEDNAKRIVACVNACAGFTTEELLVHTGPRLLHAILKNALCRIDDLLRERNSTGLAIDAAILDGVVPEQHLLRSRLEMLANHRQREQKLLEAVALATHQVITCGVAAKHHDANLSRRESDYGGKWDTPQAESVRQLRQERDELLEALKHLHHNTKESGAEVGLALDVAESAIAKAKGGAA